MKRLFVCICAGILNAHAASLNVTVDDAKVSRDVPFLVSVEAVGTEIGELIIPAIDGAIIDGSPRETAIQMSNVNGKTSISKIYRFAVVAEKVGPLVIPPFSAVVDGERIESNSLKLEVVVERLPTRGSRERRTLTADQVLFIEIKTDKETVYKGEPVELLMEMWLHSECRITLLPGGTPEVTGFYAVPRNPELKGDRRETRDGETYQVRTYSQTLYPTSTGNLRIGPWTLEGMVSAGFAPHHMQRRTDPIFVTVNPLPPAPANFSGTIGKFRISAELRRNQTEPGVPATFVVRLEGRGNPDAIGEPRLPEIPGAFVDEPKRSQKPATGSDVALEFAYRVTPSLPGPLEIPSIEYSYFDAEMGAYTTIYSEPQVLQVLGSRKPESQIVIGEGGTTEPLVVTETDLLPIQRNASLARRPALAVPAALSASVPILSYIALAFFVHRKRRFATDIQFARAHRALQTGLEGLNEALSGAQPVDKLYKAVTGFVADEFNLPESGMTSVDAKNVLESRHVPDDLIAGIVRVLKTCERARYAAEVLSPEEIAALTEGAKAIMSRLDEFRKKGQFT